MRVFLDDRPILIDGDFVVPELELPNMEVQVANPQATYVEIERSGRVVPWDNVNRFCLNARTVHRTIPMS